MASSRSRGGLILWFAMFWFLWYNWVTPSNSYTTWTFPGTDRVVGGVFIIDIGAVLLGVVLFLIYRVRAPRLLPGRGAEPRHADAGARRPRRSGRALRDRREPAAGRGGRHDPPRAAPVRAAGPTPGSLRALGPAGSTREVWRHHDEETGRDGRPRDRRQQRHRRGHRRRAGRGRGRRSPWWPGAGTGSRRWPSASEDRRRPGHRGRRHRSRTRRRRRSARRCPSSVGSTPWSTTPA